MSHAPMGETAPKDVALPATCRIDVPKDKLDLLDEYGHLDVGKMAELTVSGKVTAVRRDQHGGCIEIELSGNDDAGSLKDDMAASKRSRTMGYEDDE